MTQEGSGSSTASNSKSWAALLNLANTLKLAPPSDRVAPRGKLLPGPRAGGSGGASIARFGRCRSIIAVPAGAMACSLTVADRMMRGIDLHQAGPLRL